MIVPGATALIRSAQLAHGHGREGGCYSRMLSTIENQKKLLNFPQ